MPWLWVFYRKRFNFFLIMNLAGHHRRWPFHCRKSLRFYLLCLFCACAFLILIGLVDFPPISHPTSNIIQPQRFRKYSGRIFLVIRCKIAISANDHIAKAVWPISKTNIPLENDWTAPLLEEDQPTYLLQLKLEKSRPIFSTSTSLIHENCKSGKKAITSFFFISDVWFLFIFHFSFTSYTIFNFFLFG